MSKLPDLSFIKSSLFSGKRNDKGQLCNIYTPLQNLADDTTKKLGDFTTPLLNFDMEHPVDIILQDSYDGAVNMVLNDGKNRPRLINSRFSVQDENTFKIPDHSGFKDTNIYDEETFDVDVQLKAIPIKIPIIKYEGLIDNGGKLPCGSYTFYFKLADADGNETEVIAESGIVQCHIGTPNSPNSIRMGLENENSSKAIKFTLTNIDAGFDFIHVLFSRTSSGDDQAAATTYHKIWFDFPVDKNGVCDITITGAENIIGISRAECAVDYADINSVKTQAVNNNVLLFGNVDTPEHDWDAIKRFTWKIIPRWSQTAPGAIGTLNTNYEETSITKDQIEDHGYCYYNTQNIYYRLGYWPDEIYRFGIVYIFSDNSLSPVINLQGIDFSRISEEKMNEESLTDECTDYESYFFTEDDYNKNRCPEYLYEEDNLYFNKKYRTNSRGVIKFPQVNVKTVANGVLAPRPLYINFDLSRIGYKYAKKEEQGEGQESIYQDGDVTPWQDVLKQHDIKGFFFVRQKRVPTILGEGVVVGLSHQLCGALPVIKNNDDNFVVQPFLNEHRLLQENAQELEVPSGYLIDTGLTQQEKLFKNQALLCPDAEIDEATYNSLFVSNDFCLYKNGQNFFKYENDEHTSNIDSFTYLGKSENSYKTKLTNIPEDTKTLTNGVDYFSTLAGNPDEPYKTVDIKNPWRWTKPQDLTVSTSLIRGKWGPFVGMNNPNEKNPVNNTCPFKYGETYTVKKLNYENVETATDLDFQSAMNSNANFFAISDRTEMTQKIDCFRGDCYISMFTHRMFRNFIDPELPTNDQIIDPSCWCKNYGVRCTAQLINDSHSNLTSDSDGWYIGPKDDTERWVQAAIYLLTGNIIGFFMNAFERIDDPNKIGLKTDPEGNPIYENGYANEVVQAFEVYIGGAAFNPLMPLTSIITKFKNAGGYYDSNHYWEEPRKKKINPKEQEKQGGFNLKAIFKADDDWELRGLSGINRADVNAVGMGQWITFPICSNKNLAMRDVDFSNATEEASFNRKRSFYPLAAKDIHNPLRDSNVINASAGVSLPDKPYVQIPKVPYFKQEYFTRINNSLRDSSSSVTNEFKVILESAYHDYTKNYGSITKLESKGNYVYVIFKHGIGILDMSSSITQAQDATQFLPEVSIISDTYGSMWKDSVVQTPYGIYGVDSVAKVIWKIEGTNVKVVSDMKVEKFLIDNLDMSEFNFRPYIGHINIKSHYNAFKHDVIFTYYNDLLYELPAKYPSKAGYSVDLDGYIIDSEGKKFYIDPETEEIVFYGKAKRLLPEYDEETHKWQSYSDIIEGKDYQWVKGTNWSLCWNEDLQSFQTFYDWIPVESENIDNIYFSFDRDGIVELRDNTKDYLIEPKFVGRNTSRINNRETGYITYSTEEESNLNLGVKQNKSIIDSAFTNETKIYTVKKKYKNIVFSPRLVGNKELFTVLSPKNFEMQANKDYVFSMYLRVPEEESNNLTISFITSTTGIARDKQLPKPEDWTFVMFYIRPKIDCTLDTIKIAGDLTYQFCEPKLMPYTGNPINYGTEELETLSCYMIQLEKQDGMFKDYYDIRTTDNSMKLWKHGQSGIYDNQGKIKPTNWYGKQHEFNFEFVVNENASIQKIFNNLKIISNKAEPYKFEYEVVGEGYEWYEYKEIVYWINSKVKSEVFPTLHDGYHYVLTHTLGEIHDEYTDFPELFNKPQDYYIKKLPYLEIKLTDKKGIPDKDKSYTTHTTKVDNWSDVKNNDGKYDYKLNSSEAILVEDEQLNEYRIHTEQFGNNMKKYGRVRGNMEYLEDLWDIEVRPIYFKWVYVAKNENNEFFDGLSETPMTEARLRDKYIKIKVRYTGEDLVIIQAIQTMFDYSFA